MRVVLCPPSAHQAAGHTACQTLPSLGAPPTCMHARGATRGDTGQPSEGSEGKGSQVCGCFPSSLPSLPPLQVACRHGCSSSVREDTQPAAIPTTE